jgi:hypothetical protein
MKNILTIILLFVFSMSFAQKTKPITNYGPNIGIITNSEKFESNILQFGFSVRRIHKWKYIQPEVNLTWNSENSQFSEMRVPVLFGIRALRTIRFNIGGELRSELSFIGNSKRGLNVLAYESIPTYVSPIVGIGVDINRLSLDFRVSPQSADLVNIKPQFSTNISFLFGKRKGELEKF